MGHGRWPLRTDHYDSFGWTGDRFWSWSPSCVDLCAVLTISGVAGPDLEVMQGCQRLVVSAHWDQLQFLYYTVELLAVESDAVFVSRFSLLRWFEIVAEEHDGCLLL